MFHAMGVYQQKLERKQKLMGRLVNIGTDLFAMAAACSKAVSLYSKNAKDDGPLELADLFCCQARGRIIKHFRQLYCNHDAFVYDLAQNTLAGKYRWLETDIIHPE